MFERCPQNIGVIVKNNSMYFQNTATVSTGLSGLINWSCQCQEQVSLYLLLGTIKILILC